MIRKEIKTLTIEYEDGSVDTFKEPGMFHVSRNGYPRGNMDRSEGFTVNEIRWIAKELKE